MKLPIKDKKFLFLLFAITIVISLEVLSIIGIHIPMPYAPFVFAIFIIGIGFVERSKSNLQTPIQQHQFTNDHCSYRSILFG
jgi:hypothetical protein